MSQHSNVIEALKNSRLAVILGEGEAEALCDLLTVTEFEQGHVFVARGAPATSAGVIVAGSAEVILEGRRVAVLEAGQIFGESMFSSEGARTADLRATSSGCFAAFTSDDFQDLLDSHPQLALRCQGFFEAEYARTQERDAGSRERDTTRYVALIAHNEMKSTLLDFVKSNRTRLGDFPLVATGTTGTLIYQETGMVLNRRCGQVHSGGIRPSAR